MKKNKKASIGAKAVSSIVILCMMFSLTACNGSYNSQHDAAISTYDDEKIDEITHGVDEPHQDIDEGVDIADPTAIPTPITSGPAGSYSYNLYGRSIAMDINVDDYIKNYGGQEYFNFGKLAQNLGWVKVDYLENLYRFQSGDLVAQISLGEYGETVPGTSYSQLSVIDYGFIYNDGRAYYDESVEKLSHHSSSTRIDMHYSQCKYQLLNPICLLSYDDIVLLSYVLWLGATNPTENPMVSGFGEDFEYMTWSGDGATLYVLP